MVEAAASSESSSYLPPGVVLVQGKASMQVHMGRR